jgi:hypothetical protein
LQNPESDKERPKNFLQSIILCGVRDVWDYRIHATSEKAPVTGGSAFNINSESLRIGAFNCEEFTTLYRQHTEATGQSFSSEALQLAFDLTQGQPWLQKVFRAMLHQLEHFLLSLLQAVLTKINFL